MPRSGPRSHPRRCGSYHPGHEIHWIHARKASESRSWCKGVILATRATVMDIWDGTEVRRYRHHDPATVHSLVEVHGPIVDINCEWHMLRIASQLLNVADVTGPQRRRP